MITFEDKERLDLIDRLDDHGLFIDALWGLSDLYYSDHINTACVQMKDDRIKMIFNKQFYDNLGERGQMFVVCHEQLHIMSDHFNRLDFAGGDGPLKNKAADVAINHSLVRNYFFEREDLPDWERYCWTETVFPDMDVSDNETAEYYYMLLKQMKDQDKESGGEELDEHDPDDDGNKPSDQIKEAIENAQDQLEEILDASDDGDAPAEDRPADMEEILDKRSFDTSNEQDHSFSVKPKPALWKQLFLQIPKSISATRNGTHWIERNRNHRLLPSSLMMPGNFESSYQEKVVVHVYLDTSGSCVDHAEHFLRSALTLPPNMFKVKLHGFCHDVYELPKKPPYKLVGFGAENYFAVEDHVEDQKRVDAVMVFTDGYSSMVQHENPQKWHWFITPDGITDNIDPKAKTYLLQNYGWRG